MKHTILLRLTKTAFYSIITCYGLFLTWAMSVYLREYGLSGCPIGWAIFLTTITVFADRYPIHLQRHTKITLISVPIYLQIVLFPPILSICTVGISVLLADILAYRERGVQLFDICFNLARWQTIALLGGLVMLNPTPYELPMELLLFISAIVIMLTELLISVFFLAQATKEQFISLIKLTIIPESIQYLLGILGVLATYQNPWAKLLLIVPCALVYYSFKRTKELQNSTLLFLENLADTVDLRDPYTGGHSRRVAQYCADIFRELNIYGDEAELVITTARIHDIGKIGIPDSILKKEGPLTHEERTIMETHPEQGAALLARYPDFSRGAAIVRHHHERWDGAGYPSRLAKTDIPYGARVIAVADSYDAMTSDRPYRLGMSQNRAMLILREGRGTQWDPEIVDAFLTSLTRKQNPDSVTPAPLPSIVPASQASALPAQDLLHIENAR